MEVKAVSWRSLSEKPISIDAIRRLHLPESHYRVSQYSCDVGVRFLATGKAGRLYVVSGHCVQSSVDWRAELGSGMFVDFPAGHYTFEVIGDEPASIVNVWEIPEPYRVKRRQE